MGGKQAIIFHIKAMHVLFHLMYGSFVCSKRLQSERPKCGGMMVDPRAFQNHAEIG